MGQWGAAHKWHQVVWSSSPKVDRRKSPASDFERMLAAQIVPVIYDFRNYKWALYMFVGLSFSCPCRIGCGREDSGTIGFVLSVYEILINVVSGRIFVRPGQRMLQQLLHSNEWLATYSTWCGIESGMPFSTTYGYDTSSYWYLRLHGSLRKTSTSRRVGRSIYNALLDFECRNLPSVSIRCVPMS